LAASSCSASRRTGPEPRPGAGTQREDSDIDLVVIADDFSGMDYWQRIGLLSDAIYEVFKPIEAVAMTRAEWEKGESFIAEIARNGEVVFAA